MSTKTVSQGIISLRYMYLMWMFEKRMGCNERWIDQKKMYVSFICRLTCSTRDGTPLPPTAQITSNASFTQPNGKTVKKAWRELAGCKNLESF